MKNTFFTLSFLATFSYSSRSYSQGIPQPAAAPNPQQQMPMGIVSGQNGALLGSDGHQLFLGKNMGGSSGSPFLYPQWLEGTVKLHNGTIYKDLKILYDQLNDKLLFCTDESQPQEFVEKVAEFSIAFTEDDITTIRTFKNGYTPIDGYHTSTYYEVLVGGPTQLLKRSTKAMVEEAATGSIHKTKQVKEIKTSYYLVTTESIGRIKRDFKSLIPFLRGNEKKVESFVKSTNLNLKKERDLAAAVNYFNTL